jgi:O6-methylguanine-DNA--protein-cysteine methyltransferase
MTTKSPSCRAIELDLVATATGDAEVGSAERVHRHLETCSACRDEYSRYRAVDSVARALRPTPPAEALAKSRAGLESRLADLRQRRVAYRIFPSPLGHILIGRSEHGIAVVEYLHGGSSLRASRLARVEGVEAVPGGEELERLQRDLLDYITGRRRSLDWTLDWRLARSDFERAVLEATANIPYGAVASYAGIARRIGKPGRLTGYAGDKLDLKHQLLSVEGVKLHAGRGDVSIAREAMYALGEGTTEYCLPTCADIGTRSLSMVTLFASRADAEARGLTPCADCRPDLHPLSAA